MACDDKLPGFAREPTRCEDRSSFSKAVSKLPGFARSPLERAHALRGQVSLLQGVRAGIEETGERRAAAATAAIAVAAVAAACQQ